MRDELAALAHSGGHRGLCGGALLASASPFLCEWDLNMTILTPCPPRSLCKVCEGRLTHIFGGAQAKDKTAKYRHQAGDNGTVAFMAIIAGNIDKAYASARRAATYAAMALDAQGSR